MRYLIRERFFHLTEDSTITDENGQPVFQVNGKLFSIHNTLVMRDMAGAEVATIRKHLIALRPTYEISHQGQEMAEVRKRLFTPFVDRFTVDIPGPDDLEIGGSIFEHEFTIHRGNELVATVSKRWFSLTDAYAVDVAPGQNAALVLASVLALDLAEDAERQSRG
ncbi:MAG: LURP-one-related/scramblase family protein [Ktedonobacterales bacterium]